MRRMMVTVLVGLCVSAALLAGAAKEKPDPVETLVAQGLARYKAGKTAEAIGDLQQAIALMQQSLQKGLAAFFPEAPQGWQAGKVESSAVAAAGTGGEGGSWTQVSRKYTRQADRLAVTVEMTNSPQLIQAQQGLSSMYRNPQMLQVLNQDPNRKVELVQAPGWFGWIVVEKGKTAQAAAYCKSCLLTVQVPKGDEQVLKTFWNAIDLKGLAAGGK
jgi:hypothetical protein